MKLRKRTKIACVLFLVLVAIATAYAITINILPTEKLGFWNQQAEDTEIQVLRFNHFILTPNKIRTKITLYNPSTSTINANVTIFYRSGSTDLVTYSFNATIQPSQRLRKTFTVNLDVSLWNTTDISIFEY